MNIIEYDSDFNTFIKDYEKQTSILVPIFDDARLHPAQNGLCLMGVCEVESGDVTILPFNHPESPNLGMDLLPSFSKGIEIWTPDKKALEFLPIEDQGHIEDVQALEYIATGNVTNVEEFYSPIIRRTHERLYNEDDVNHTIPLGKWAEFIRDYCEHIRAIIKEHNAESWSKGYSFLVGTAIPALRWIESNGLHINPRILKQHFGPRNRFIVNDLIYSQYNLFTAAGRPSCRFGGINFAALNKDDGQRAAFTSRFDDGILVNIDFESYHVRLIANHLGYKLPSTPAHEYFGKYYFGTTDLTDEQYDESKTKTFKLLYSAQPSDIPFFAKVSQFKESLWDEIRTMGSVQSPLVGKKILLDHIYEPNPAKVFNYFVQFMETEQNLTFLSNLQELFEGKRSKIILYNYDSFLIDFSMSDGKALLIDMVDYLEQGKKFPVRVKYGKNFNEMVKYSIRDD